jgi:hypothetical protein
MAVTLAAQTGQRPNLAGTWRLNAELSSAPGSGPVPGDSGPPDGGRAPGGMGGVRGRGGMPGGGGFGGRPDGGGDGRRPSSEEMERRRALREELTQLPPRFTLAQKDDTITFIEPDGVVRSYVANGKSEKHQLVNGIVETRTRWKGEGFEMELTVDRLTLRRTFALRSGEVRQLEVTAAFDGGRRDAKPRYVYDAAEPE